MKATWNPEKSNYSFEFTIEELAIIKVAMEVALESASPNNKKAITAVAKSLNEVIYVPMITDMDTEKEAEVDKL